MLKRYSLILLTVFFLTPVFANERPLPASAIFKLTVNVQDPNAFVLNWQVKPGYFLYQDRISITLHPHAQDTAEIKNIIFPAADKKTDHQNNTFNIYRENVRIPVIVLGKQPGEILLDVHAQGCADSGFCYPPQITPVIMSINPDLALSNVMISSPIEVSNHNPVTSQDMTKSLFSQHNHLMTLCIFLGLGLLLSFTPCILPMIPVLSSIIVGHGDKLTTRKAFLLSLCYVMSMSATYALVGAVVALMGQNLQIVMQSPWIIGAFSFVFVLLALAMFDVYELRLPLAWQNKLAKASYHQQRGHYLGALIMGFLSTLILSPCVTAPLIGALSYIAQTGDVLLGVSALFMLGFGMGIPLLLIGTSFGKWLPHAGHWMNMVKGFFGLILLGVAIELLSRIVPASIIMGMWAILFIFSALSLGIFRKTKSNFERLFQSIALFLLIYGILILVGASQGHINPWKPLSSPTSDAYSPVSSRVLHTLDETQKALQQARMEHRPVIMDFYADWCRSCKAIEAMIHDNATIQKQLQSFIILKIDLTANDANSEALRHQFDVIAPPTFLFFDDKGQTLAERLVGEISSQELTNALNATLHQ
jgi:thiol:disulfide interchange protein DsbD